MCSFDHPIFLENLFVRFVFHLRPCPDHYYYWSIIIITSRFPCHVNLFLIVLGSRISSSHFHLFSLSSLCVLYVETLTGVLFWSFDLLGNIFEQLVFHLRPSPDHYYFLISTWLLVCGQLCPLRCWTLGHHILDWFDSCLQYRRVILFFFGFYVIHLVV